MTSGPTEITQNCHGEGVHHAALSLSEGLWEPVWRLHGAAPSAAQFKGQADGQASKGDINVNANDRCGVLDDLGDPTTDDIVAEITESLQHGQLPPSVRCAHGEDTSPLLVNTPALRERHKRHRRSLTTVLSISVPQCANGQVPSLEGRPPERQTLDSAGGIPPFSRLASIKAASGTMPQQATSDRHRSLADRAAPQMAVALDKILPITTAESRAVAAPPNARQILEDQDSQIDLGGHTPLVSPTSPSLVTPYWRGGVPLPVDAEHGEVSNNCGVAASPFPCACEDLDTGPHVLGDHEQEPLSRTSSFRPARPCQTWQWVVPSALPVPDEELANGNSLVDGAILEPDTALRVTRARQGRSSSSQTSVGRPGGWEEVMGRLASLEMPTQPRRNHLTDARRDTYTPWTTWADEADSTVIRVPGFERPTTGCRPTADHSEPTAEADGWQGDFSSSNKITRWFQDVQGSGSSIEEEGASIFRTRNDEARRTVGLFEQWQG